MMMVSLGRMTPKSPWRASDGCRHTACMPRLLNVADNFVAMCPDLPIPVKITLP